MSTRQKRTTPKIASWNQITSAASLKRSYSYIRNAQNKTSPSLAIFPNLEGLFFDTFGERTFRAASREMRKNYRPGKPSAFLTDKSRTSLRLMVSLPVFDGILYQSILDKKSLGGIIDSQLINETCFANRLAGGEKIYLKEYIGSYLAYIKKQQKLAEEGFNVRAKIDISNFYPSIDHAILFDTLENLFGVKKESKAARTLNLMLKKWSCLEYEGKLIGYGMGKGLPTGYDASAVLANAYLAPVDRIMIDQTDQNSTYFRYNDDIIIMAKTVSDVSRLLGIVNREILSVGLQTNGKGEFSSNFKTADAKKLSFTNEYDFDEPPTSNKQKALQVAEKAIEEGIDGLSLKERQTLNYFLKCGERASLKPYLKLAITILLTGWGKSADYSARYLEKSVRNKKRAEELLVTYYKESAKLTSWQRYNLARVCASSGNLTNEDRITLAKTIDDEQPWHTRFLRAILYAQAGKTGAITNPCQNLNSTSIIQTAALACLTWNHNFNGLPKVIESALEKDDSTSSAILNEAITGKKVNTKNLALRPTAKANTDCTVSKRDLEKSTKDIKRHVTKSFKEFPYELLRQNQENNRLPEDRISYKREGENLITFTHPNGITSPMELKHQYVHTLIFAVNRAKSEPNGYFTSEEAWRNLLRTSTGQSRLNLFKGQKTKREKDNIDKSIARHCNSINKKLEADFGPPVTTSDGDFLEKKRNKYRLVY